MKKKILTFILCIAFVLSMTGCAMSKEEIAEMNTQALASLDSAAMGDVVQFGVYNDEPIQWNVVSGGDGLYLLSASNIIGTKCYNDEGGSDQTNSELFYANEWANCSLRQWLNTEFYDTAFDDTAKAAIVKCNLTNSIKEALVKPGGDDTQDNVFILSYAECVEFLHPLELLDIEEQYWLRNPSGTNGKNAALCSGVLRDRIKGPSVSEEHGVRPAIWVTTNSTEVASLCVGPATIYDGPHYEFGGGSSKSGKCSNCNGSGKVKYYYGSSSLEAALNGQDDYTYGDCGACGGTGRK